MDTLRVAMGYDDGNKYTKEDVLNDKSWNLYYYVELICAHCSKGLGYYQRVIINSRDGSEFHACDSCELKSYMTRKFDRT